MQVHLRNVPYRSVQETNRTVQETNRTVQEANRTVQSVQDNLYANPAPKSEPYRADYHVTFIF